MHGVTKAQMQKIQQSKETEKITTNYLSLLSKYSDSSLTAENKLKINMEILMIASQNYQFWNDRKELLTKIMKKNETETVESETEEKEEMKEIKNKNEEILQNELKLTEKLLPLNSKAYVVWYHRKWAMNLLQNKNYERERKLCAGMLKYDSRNCLFYLSILFNIL